MQINLKKKDYSFVIGATVAPILIYFLNVAIRTTKA